MPTRSGHHEIYRAESGELVETRGLIAPLPLLWVGLIVAGSLAMVFRMRGMRGGQAPAVRLVDPPEQSEHMADPGA